MKVLFISGGNSPHGISPIVLNQANSLQKFDDKIEVDFFLIKGTGIKGYWKNIRPLRKKMINSKYDLVHAHYSLSAFVATLAGAKPLIVSLMGSDVKVGFWYKWIIRFFNMFFWKTTIVKSTDMKNSLGIKSVKVIPNGVNLNIFRHIDKVKCQNKLGWDTTKKHLLFPSNPNRSEKNFSLFEASVMALNDKSLCIHTLINVPNIEVPLYMNASDVVCLTSLWEGSPNVIKEAMACNVPIVSTPVGDVEWLLNGVDGCFIANFNFEEYANQVKQALLFTKENQNTNGIQKLLKLGIDDKSIAENIVKIYFKDIV